MEILKRLNWIDILAIIIMLRMSYVAFQDGLSHQIFPLVGSIFIVVISLHYYIKLANIIHQNLLYVPIEVLNFLSFLILAIIIGFIFKFLRVILDNVIKVTWHPVIERFGGLVVGIARAIVAVSIVLIILALVPLSYLQWSIRDKSVTGMYFLKVGPGIYEKVSRFLPTIKIGDLSVKRDVTGELISDKSIAPKAKKEKTP